MKMNVKARSRRKTRAVSQADYELLAGFRHTLREFIHFSHEAAAAAGITPHQHEAMLVIKSLVRNHQPNVGELAAWLKIRHQSAVGLVNRMIRRGLIRKCPAALDHRQVLVHLTAAGEDMLHQLTAAHKAEITRLGPVLQSTLAKLNSIS